MGVEVFGDLAEGLLVFWGSGLVDEGVCDCGVYSLGEADSGFDEVLVVGVDAVEECFDLLFCYSYHIRMYFAVFILGPLGGTRRWGSFDSRGRGLTVVWDWCYCSPVPLSTLGGCFIECLEAVG